MDFVWSKMFHFFPIFLDAATSHAGTNAWRIPDSQQQYYPKKTQRLDKKKNGEHIHWSDIYISTEFLALQLTASDSGSCSHSLFKNKWKNEKKKLSQLSVVVYIFCCAEWYEEIKNYVFCYWRSRVSSSSSSGCEMFRFPCLPSKFCDFLMLHISLSLSLALLSLWAHLIQFHNCIQIIFCVLLHHHHQHHCRRLSLCFVFSFSLFGLMFETLNVTMTG